METNKIQLAIFSTNEDYESAINRLNPPILIVNDTDVIRVHLSIELNCDTWHLFVARKIQLWLMSKGIKIVSKHNFDITVGHRKTVLLQHEYKKYDLRIDRIVLNSYGFTSNEIFEVINKATQEYIELIERR